MSSALRNHGRLGIDWENVTISNFREPRPLSAEETHVLAQISALGAAHISTITPHMRRWPELFQQEVANLVIKELVPNSPDDTNDAALTSLTDFAKTWTSRLGQVRFAMATLVRARTSALQDVLSKMAEDAIDEFTDPTTIQSLVTKASKLSNEKNQAALLGIAGAVTSDAKLLANIVTMANQLTIVPKIHVLQRVASKTVRNRELFDLAVTAKQQLQAELAKIDSDKIPDIANLMQSWPEAFQAEAAAAMVGRIKTTHALTTLLETVSAWKNRTYLTTFFTTSLEVVLDARLKASLFDKAISILGGPNPSPLVKALSSPAKILPASTQAQVVALVADISSLPGYSDATTESAAHQRIITMVASWSCFDKIAVLAELAALTPTLEPPVYIARERLLEFIRKAFITDSDLPAWVAQIAIWSDPSVQCDAVKGLLLKMPSPNAFNCLLIIAKKWEVPKLQLSFYTAAMQLPQTSDHLIEFAENTVGDSRDPDLLKQLVTIAAKLPPKASAKQAAVLKNVIAKGVNLELIEAILEALKESDLMAKIDVLAALIHSHPNPDDSLLSTLVRARDQLFEAVGKVPDDKAYDLAGNQKGLMNDWSVALQLEAALHLLPIAGHKMRSALRIRANHVWKNHPLAKVQFYAAELATKDTFTDRYNCKDLAIDTVKNSKTPEDLVLLAALVAFAEKMVPEPRIVDIFEYVIPLNKEPQLLRRIFDIARGWHASSLMPRHRNFTDDKDKERMENSHDNSLKGTKASAFTLIVKHSSDPTLHREIFNIVKEWGLSRDATEVFLALVKQTEDTDLVEDIVKILKTWNIVDCEKALEGKSVGFVELIGDVLKAAVSKTDDLALHQLIVDMVRGWNPATKLSPKHHGIDSTPGVIVGVLAQVVNKTESLDLVQTIFDHILAWRGVYFGAASYMLITIARSTQGPIFHERIVSIATKWNAHIATMPADDFIAETSKSDSIAFSNRRKAEVLAAVAANTNDKALHRLVLDVAISWCNRMAPKELHTDNESVGMILIALGKATDDLDLQREIFDYLKKRDLASNQIKVLEALTSRATNYALLLSLLHLASKNTYFTTELSLYNLVLKIVSKAPYQLLTARKNLPALLLTLSELDPTQIPTIREYVEKWPHPVEEVTTVLDSKESTVSKSVALALVVKSVKDLDVDEALPILMTVVEKAREPQILHSIVEFVQGWSDAKKKATIYATLGRVLAGNGHVRDPLFLGEMLTKLETLNSQTPLPHIARHLAVIGSNESSVRRRVFNFAHTWEDEAAKATVFSTLANSSLDNIRPLLITTLKAWSSIAAQEQVLQVIIKEGYDEAQRLEIFTHVNTWTDADAKARIFSALAKRGRTLDLTIFNAVKDWAPSNAKETTLLTLASELYDSKHHPLLTEILCVTSLQAAVKLGRFEGIVSKAFSFLPPAFLTNRNTLPHVLLAISRVGPSCIDKLNDEMREWKKPLPEKATIIASMIASKEQAADQSQLRSIVLRSVEGMDDKMAAERVLAAIA